MLELIKDNRSGNKLEIFVFVYNEESRLPNILNYYSDEFDIVVADGNSTDKTVAIALQSNATVYRRIIETDSNFVNYANNLTKSGYTFLLHADEFIKKEDIRDAFKALQTKSYVIMGRRIDWFYGERMTFGTGVMPRGLCAGWAVFNTCNLHDPYKYKVPHDKKCKELIFDIEHFNVVDVKKNYGTVGKYAYTETEIFRKQKLFGVMRFIRRFLISLLIFPIKRWRMIKDFKMYLIMWVSHFIVLFTALYCLIEQKYYISPDEQKRIYDAKYK